MPDFSIVVQDARIQALVQQNILERAFHDALFPRLLFRGEATPILFPGNLGDSITFTGVGLIQKNLRPVRPGDDPQPKSYTEEQWTTQMQQYADTIDTHMPTSMVAIADLFMRNAHQLGMQAALTLNTWVRDRLYNAALSGWTVADGAQNATSTLRVKRLNGFTRARNPNTVGASQVRFDPVSSANPLSVSIFDTAGPAYVTRTVTGFTADTPGDEIGPGTLTLTGGAVTVLDRAVVYSVDRTFIVRVGGGDSVDSIGPQDIPTLANVRTAVAHFRQDNVPEHEDARFHCHIDPDSEASIFGDPEFQRLLTSMPDYYMYRQFALGEILGVVFFRNSECPITTTVTGGASASFSLDDPFAGELFSNGATTGTPVHRMLFTAQGGIMEYYMNLAALITEAGVTGRIGAPSINNNGIEVFADRIQLIIRAPLNRLQDKVATSWKFIGDWPVRTDAATGGVQRFKREMCIEHAGT